MRSRWIRPFGYLLVATVGLAVVVWTVNIALARGVEQATDVAVNKSARVSYQGRLTNPSGSPLTGQFEMRFRVYPEETGGGVLWESVNINVTVDDGLFNVGLGIDQSVVNGQPLWLEVQIGNEVLSPRQPLQSAPYALGLFPGTEVEQNASGDGLTVRNVSTGAAVRGESPFGSGLYGYTEDSSAVYGYDGGTTQARGYGGYFYSENGIGLFGMSNAPSQPQNQWAPGVAGQSSEGVGVYGRSDSARSSMAAVLGEQTGTGTGGIFRSENGVALLVSRNTGLGNVIEAWRQNPQKRLMRLTTDGDLYIDGTLNSGGADFAELLPAADGLEPGDVLVIGANGELARSSEAYQPSVVGVYSTKPGLLGGAPTDGESAEELQEASAYDGMAPLAIIGIVPVKVSAENGPIAAGDLLTAASIPGHAMRCTDVSLCFGRTLGKALEDLPRDTGVIQALVTLQ